ncbi:unnamed protein product [Heterobilharzia americana]|nr:unnamed protein product [Heterobilharzia americana]
MINNPEVYQKFKKNLKKKSLSLIKHSSQKSGLPKHFNAKKRHRNRGLSSSMKKNTNSKLKLKTSRKQKRLKKT